MLSDLATYYDDRGCAVAPFLIAPVLDQQDTLIIGPTHLASEHDRFLNECFRRMPLDLNGILYLRVFSYRSKIAIIMVFPTSVEEEGSKRTGLMLTIGLLTEKSIFRANHSLSREYFANFIYILNDVFDVDLMKGGADEILKRINRASDHEVLASHFSRILDDLLTVSSGLRQQTFWQTLMPKRAWNGKISNMRSRLVTPRPKTLPKAILCNDISSSLIAALFLGEIDHYLRGGLTKRIDVASQRSSSGRSMEIIELNQSVLDEVSALDLIKLGRRKCVRLY